MPDPILVTCKLAAVSGIPEDDVTTDWAFNAASLDEADLLVILAAIEDWWNVGNTSGNSMANYISDVVSRSADSAEFAVYDLTGHLDGSPHGSPILTLPWTPGGAAGTAGASFPSEVAIRHTVNAAGFNLVPEQAPNPAPPPATIRPRARYRGGFFVGPLMRTCATFAAEEEPRVSGAYRGDAADAWDRLLSTAGGSDFGIWSRADEVIRPVLPAVGSPGLITIDNAFDTIRKRGQASDSRVTVWPLP